jgi:hypothetical protein
MDQARHSPIYGLVYSACFSTYLCGTHAVTSKDSAVAVRRRSSKDSVAAVRHHSSMGWVEVELHRSP